jgi:hypothetical protein
MEITFRQLGVCYYGLASLSTGRVCNLQLLLSLASAVFLGFQSRGNHDHILLFQFLDSPNLGVSASKVKTKLSYDRRSVGQSVLV